VGTIIILLIKYVFLHIRMMWLYIKHLPDMLECKKLPFLPFWICGLAAVISLGPVLLVLAVMVSPLVGLRCPYVAITHNMNLIHGFKEALNLLIKLDKMTYEFEWNFRVLKDIDLDLDFQPPADTRNQEITEYWDLFIKNCKEVCTNTKEKGWITEEDIEGAMPNVLTAVPAMTILKILLRSIEEDNTKEIIVWDDSNICTSSNRNKDDLSEFFWPKIKSIVKKLKSTSKDEQLYMMAQLCANSETNTTALEEALADLKIEEKKTKKVHGISAEINNIVIILLRMEQMQKRLPQFLTI